LRENTGKEENGPQKKKKRGWVPQTKRAQKKAEPVDHSTFSDNTKNNPPLKKEINSLRSPNETSCLPDVKTTKHKQKIYCQWFSLGEVGGGKHKALGWPGQLREG